MVLIFELKHEVNSSLEMALVTGNSMRALLLTTVSLLTFPLTFRQFWTFQNSKGVY
jgi:hypothetical protein